MTALTYAEFIEALMGMDLTDIDQLPALPASNRIVQVVTDPDWNPTVFNTNGLPFFSFVHGIDQDYAIEGDLDSFFGTQDIAGTTNLLYGNVGRFSLEEIADGVTTGITGNLNEASVTNSWNLSLLIQGDLGTANFNQANGLELLVDGFTFGPIAISDTSDAKIDLANADGANINLNNFSGTVDIRSFDGGTLFGGDINAGMNVGQANGALFDVWDTYLSYAQIGGHEFEFYGYDINLDTGYFSGENVEIEVYDGTGGNWYQYGHNPDVTLDEVVLDHLRVGEYGELNVDDSLIDFAKIGRGTEVEIDDSHVMAELKGGNRVTVTDSDVLLLAENGETDTIIFDEGASVTAALDAHDVVQIGLFQTTADKLVDYNDGQGHVGNVEWFIGVGDSVPLIGVAGGGGGSLGGDFGEKG